MVLGTKTQMPTYIRWKNSERLIGRLGNTAQYVADLVELTAIEADMSVTPVKRKVGVEMNFENAFGLAILVLNICTLVAFYVVIDMHTKAMKEHRSALAELIDLEVLK